MDKNEKTTKLMKALNWYLIIDSVAALFVTIAVVVPFLPVKIIGVIFGAYMAYTNIGAWRFYSKKFDDVPPKTLGEKIDEMTFHKKETKNEDNVM